MNIKMWWKEKGSPWWEKNRSIVKKFIRPLMFIVLVALIGAGTFLLYSKQADSKLSKKGDDSYTTAYVESTNMSASFKMGGRVSEMLVKEGDFVKKGDVLAKLESKELENKVAQAKAAVELAKGKISEAKGATATAEAKQAQGSAAVKVTADSTSKQVTQAEAAAKAAEAQLQALQNGARPEELEQAKSKLTASKEVLQVAEQNLQRIKVLFEQGAVAKAKLDEADVNYQKAKADFEVSQKQYDLAVKGPRTEEIQAAQAQLEQAQAAVAYARASEGQVAIREGDVNVAGASVAQAQGAVAQAQAGLAQAEAALAEATTYLSYTTLVAPSDGVVVSKAAEVGEMVGAGYSVFTLESRTDRWAMFYFPETELKGLKTGDHVKVKLLSNGKKINGEIVKIEPAASFAVKKATQSSGDTDIRSFGVKVILPNLPNSVETGMSVQWMGKGD